MRASRLLSLLVLLQLRGRLTAEAMAAEFEVSVRTIYRDIDELGAAGIPVVADRGPGGGFRLLDGYRTSLTGLSTDEADALHLIALPGAAAAMGLREPTLSAERKLQAALPPRLGEGAARAAARFHVDPIDWYRAAESAEHLPAVARAVLDQRGLAITYESWKGVRDWAIDPLGLVLKSGAWYLVARSGTRISTFKVSNVRALGVRDHVFERPPGFDLARHWADAVARFEAGLRTGVATLRLSAIGLTRLSALGDYAAAAVKAAAESGEALVRLPIEGIDHAALLLLGIGPELEVIEPVVLRDRLQALASEVASRQRGAA